MSYIASFYLVDTSQAEELASLAEFVPEPKKFLGVIPRKVMDTKPKFWEFISNNVSELNEYQYQYSGFAFVELFSMLPGFSAVGTSSLGARITEAMDSSFFSFTEHEAHEAMVALGVNRPTDAEIHAYFEKEGRSEESEDWVIPIQEAWGTLKNWLQQVHGNQIGLLSVG